MGTFVVMADTAVDGLSSAFGSALSNVQSTCAGYIAQALPYGLTIMGAILAVTIGVKAFKRFSH